MLAPHSSRHHRAGRLLVGSSGLTLAAVLLATPQQAWAIGNGVFSGGWSAGTVSAEQAGATTAGSAAAKAAAARQVSAKQQVQVERSVQNFRSAALALTAARAAQAQKAAEAQAAAAAQASVPNGLAVGGLMVANYSNLSDEKKAQLNEYFASLATSNGRTDGVAYDISTSAAQSAGLVWQNAILPTEVIDSTGHVTVTVKQTDSRAILTWQSFNVGADTTLVFDQKLGKVPQATWVALNRVVAGRPAADGSRVVADASKIYGQIKADGEVYVINPNGIMFGAGSSVNVTALTASALDVGMPWMTLAQRNSYFTGNNSGRMNFSFQYLFETDETRKAKFGSLKQAIILKDNGEAFTETYAVRKDAFPNNFNNTFNTVAYSVLKQDKIEGAVTVEQGASISTPALSAGSADGSASESSHLGRIVLGGPNVVNEGNLYSPDGQVILVGSRNFSLFQNDGKSGLAFDANVRGVLVRSGAEDFQLSGLIDDLILGHDSNSAGQYLVLGGNAALSADNPYLQGSMATTVYGLVPEGLVKDNSFSGAFGMPFRPVVGAEWNRPTADGLFDYQGQKGLAQGGSNFDDVIFLGGQFKRLDTVQGVNITAGQVIPDFDKKTKLNTNYARIFVYDKDSAEAYAGTVINSGLVETPRGSILAQANRIEQQGVLAASTSVNQSGYIGIKAQAVAHARVADGPTRISSLREIGSIEFGAQSATTILPDLVAYARSSDPAVGDTDRTVPDNDSARDQFVSSKLDISADQRTANFTPFQLNRSFVNIEDYLSNPGMAAITLRAGSLTYVPAGEVNINAPSIDLVTQGERTGNINFNLDFNSATSPLPSLDSFLSDAFFTPSVVIEGGDSANGAQVDVSGLVLGNALISDLAPVIAGLDMSFNLVTIARVGLNELADSPLQRDGYIYRLKNVVVDTRLAGTREDGFSWVGTPLLDASGYVDSRLATVSRFMTDGGTITLGGAVDFQRGSTINIGGGVTTFDGGFVSTTILLASDGRRVAIGNADPYTRYVGIAGVAVDDHSARWGVSTSWTNQGLVRSGAFEPGYVEGGNAGTLKLGQNTLLRRLTQDEQKAIPRASSGIVTTDLPSVINFGGTVLADAIVGPYQRAGSIYYNESSTTPVGGTLDLTNIFATSVTITAAANMAATQAVAPDRTSLLNPVFSAEALAGAGYSAIALGGRGYFSGTDIEQGKSGSATKTGAPLSGVGQTEQFTLTPDAALVLRDGATFSAQAQNVSIGGSIVAHAGAIDFTLLAGAPLASASGETTAIVPRSTFTLSSGALLDVSGVFANDYLASRDSYVGSTFVDAGSVSIQTGQRKAPFGLSYVDSLVDIDLQADARINLNGGGQVQVDGSMLVDERTGVPLGKGGSLAIRLHHVGEETAEIVPIDLSSGRERIDDNVTLAADISAFGFQGGGAFVLQVPDLTIGEGINGGTAGRINLTTDFVLGRGFGSADLTGLLTTALNVDTLALSQLQVILGTDARTATSLFEAGSLGQYQAGTIQRQAMNLGLSAYGWTDFATHASAEPRSNAGDGRFVQIARASETADAAFSLGANQTISTDAGGAIDLTIFGQMTIAGRLIAPGGSIAITHGAGRLATNFSQTLVAGDYGHAIGADPRFETLNSGFALEQGSYHTGLLAPGAVIDVSGTFLRDDFQRIYTTGTLLDGGSIRLTDRSRGMFVQSGAQLLANGATQIIQMPNDNIGLGNPFYLDVALASDAGTVAFKGVSFNGDLLAAGGDATAFGGGKGLGGTLKIDAGDSVANMQTTAAGYYSSILLASKRDARIDAITALEAPDHFIGNEVGLIDLVESQQGDRIALEAILGGGIDAVILNENPGSADRQGGLVQFDGAIEAAFGRALYIYGTETSAVRADSIAADQGDVQLAAPYIRLDYNRVTPVEDLGAGRAFWLDGSNVSRNLRFVAGGDAGVFAATANGLPSQGQIDLVGDVYFGIPTLAASVGRPFASVSLETGGDIRILPKATSQQTKVTLNPDENGRPETFTILNGYDYYPQIVAPDLQMIAAQVYPATGVQATIISGTPTNAGSIVIAKGGTTDPLLPLSVGGSLTLRAGEIDQGGVLRAPLGSISFAPVVTRETASDLAVTLLPGSETSVSLVGRTSTSGNADAALTVPYGETVDGITYLYSGTSASPLEQLPEKAISITATTADLQAGAILDLSGGGDVYATEYIPGLGGRRDVRSTSLTDIAGNAVYAILPGIQNFAGAFDPELVKNANLPDVVGQTVTLAADVVTDQGLLPAGTYTLLPGAYATMPGAYRIEQTSIANITQSLMNADGGTVVPGYYGLSGNAYRSQVYGFNVRSRSQWGLYSEITTTSGRDFFRDKAADNGLAPAALPSDAGRLSIALTALGAALKSAADYRFGIDTQNAGRGGKVDIAVKNIAVVGADSAETAAVATPGLVDNYLILTPQDIARFNATSLLLGGLRSSTVGGDYIENSASNILIATSAADPLTNPEIILTVAGQKNVLGQTLGDSLIRVLAGSNILAAGTIDTTVGQQDLVLGKTDGKVPNKSSTTTSYVQGDGALIRLSNGEAVSILRNIEADPGSDLDPFVATGTVDIASSDDTILAGGNALQIDAVVNARIDATTQLGGKTLDVKSQTIALLDNGDGANFDSERVLALLNSVDVALRASQRFEIGGPLRIAAANGSTRLHSLTIEAPLLLATNPLEDGQSFSLDAETVTYGNSNENSSDLGSVSTAGAGSFEITGDKIILTGFDRVTSGFDEFNFVAAREISFGDKLSSINVDSEADLSGTFTLPGTVTLTTPLVTLAATGRQTLQATGTAGSISVGNGGTVATSLDDSPIGGGSLTLDAATALTIDTVIAARSSSVSGIARNGDLNLGNDGAIVASGATQDFVEKTLVAPGGSVRLAAASSNIALGNVILSAGSRIDVSNDPNGAAGILEVLIDGSGSFQADGAIVGQRRNADSSFAAYAQGAQFLLDTGGAMGDLDALAVKLNTAGFSERISIRSGQQDLALNTDLVAHNIALSADGGALTVNADLDADGASGGSIGLFGRNGVTIGDNIAFSAKANDAAQRGGQIAIGTSVTSDDDVDQSTGGAIRFGTNVAIDVTDGADYAALNAGGDGASLHLRLPILRDSGGVGHLDLQGLGGVAITGARNIVVEGYQRYTTANTAGALSGFDGIIDPAGISNSDGSYVNGVWRDAYRGIVVGATGPGGLTNASYLDTSMNSSGVVGDVSNQDHVTFYQGKLVDFVQNPNVDVSGLGGIANLHFRPGIELVNGDETVRGGDIVMTSNWNLGALDGSGNLLYRVTATGEPGVLTVRAAGRLDIAASLSDGFAQSSDYYYFAGYTNGGINTDNQSGYWFDDYPTDYSDFGIGRGGAASAKINILGTNFGIQSNGKNLPAGFDAQEAEDIFAAYYAIYSDSIIRTRSYYNAYFLTVLDTNSDAKTAPTVVFPVTTDPKKPNPVSYDIYTVQYQQFLRDGGPVEVANAEIAAKNDEKEGDRERAYKMPEPPEAPQSFTDYGSYMSNYLAYLKKVEALNGTLFVGNEKKPVAPKAIPNDVDLAKFRTFYASRGNAISNSSTAGDPHAEASAVTRSFTGSTSDLSWSYNLAAGARTNSANSAATILKTSLTTEQVAAGKGDFMFGAAQTALRPYGSALVLRTGTGSISINAANNITLRNMNDSIYTAGLNAGIQDGFVDADAVLRPSTTDSIAGGTATPGTFNMLGGDVIAIAGGNITATVVDQRTQTTYEPLLPHDAISDSGQIEWIKGLEDSGVQYQYANYLPGIALQYQGLAATGSTDGIFNGSAVVNGAVQAAEQSAQSVSTGLSQVNFATLGGGNLTLEAGGAMERLSVAVASTFQASGGKSADDPAVLHEWGGGNIDLRAGGDIRAMRLTQSRGNVDIFAGGNVSSQTVSVRNLDISDSAVAADQSYFVSFNPATAFKIIDGRVTYGNLFRVLNGSLDIVARGNIDPGTLTNLLPAVIGSTASRDTVNLHDIGPSWARSNPDDAFILTSLAANVTVRGNDIYSFAAHSTGQNLGVSFLDGQSATFTPGRFEASALNGDVEVINGLFVAPSATGGLSLAAGGDLIFTGKDALFLGTSNQSPATTIVSRNLILMSDMAPDSYYFSPDNPRQVNFTLTRTANEPAFAHSSSLEPLHAGDFTPSSLIALNGSIINGQGVASHPVAGNGADDIVDIVIGEAARLYAGTDIVDMRLVAQNSRADDVTSVVAGRDIRYTFVPVSYTSDLSDIGSLPGGSTFRIGGAGQVLVAAGRDVKLAPTQPLGTAYFYVAGAVLGNAGQSKFHVIDGFSSRYLTNGIDTVGNADNPYLDSKGASIDLLYGVGPGMNTQAFINRYINPDYAPGGDDLFGALGGGSARQVLPVELGGDEDSENGLLPYYGYDLVDYVYAHGGDASFTKLVDDALAAYAAGLSSPNATTYAGLDLLDRFKAIDTAAQAQLVGEASLRFAALPSSSQQGLVDRIFFNELRLVSDQKRHADQYQNFPRSYGAIETLFPAALGYTPNFDADGNFLDTTDRVQTGSLDMTAAVVRTQFGGSVNIIGPGGNALLGGLSEDFRPQGVMTVRGGGINIFLDGNLLVNQSRVFTLGGGDLTAYSANGNLDAGRGAKTSSFLPPLAVQYQNLGSVNVDFGGIITGAGIGTLQALPGAPASDIFLLAPRGDIDAGDAGIRSSGNLFIVAVRVLNADNISTGGASFGIPTTPSVSQGNLADSSTALAGLAKVADEGPKANNIIDAIVNVAVYGLSVSDPCADPNNNDPACSRQF